ncbi:hypothetical protein F2Q68_00008893 [Brassica cretica]|uniref:Uncharacterized protein n=1 Tax=Brassica cretica TaxID=69181 RepID=A0A8S9L2T3_BRACR|nr:hypothetical protein F2Q68_00008893 [Brassica cretica]
MNPRKFPRNISSEYTEGLLPRNIPRDSFLGIFRGLGSSEIPDENSDEHFVGTSEDWTIGKSIEISRGKYKHRRTHVDGRGKISVDGTVTSSNHRNFTELIHDDVELGIHALFSSRNVKQVDPSRPVPYRSGLVFERVTAGQARAGCGPQNG